MKKNGGRWFHEGQGEEDGVKVVGKVYGGDREGKRSREGTCCCLENGSTVGQW